MVEVEIARIRVSELQDEQLLYLKEKEGNRTLPIIVGMPEINAIKLGLGKYDVPRPMTHDLMLSAITSLKAKVSYVLIDKVEEGTFFAKIVIEQSKSKKTSLDARPSDSIAIAVRAGVRVFVNEAVLKGAGVVLSGGGPHDE